MKFKAVVRAIRTGFNKFGTQYESYVITNRELKPFKGKKVNVEITEE